jgi:hypothetical protein
MREHLEGMGLPPGDLHALPASAKRFPDGAQYRIEIPSVEGPRCLEAVLEEASRFDVRVHRVSQGSGVFLHTDAELDEMARLGAAAPVEVSLFTRPNAAWGTSAMARSAAGATLAPAAHGQEQVVACLDDARRAADHGFRSVLIADIACSTRSRHEGGRTARSAGEDLGDAGQTSGRTVLGVARSINLPTDLSLAQIAAVRAAVDCPLTCTSRRRTTSAAVATRSRAICVAAPVYVKFGCATRRRLSAGSHLTRRRSRSRERVRARLAWSLERSGKAATSVRRRRPAVPVVG